MCHPYYIPRVMSRPAAMATGCCFLLLRAIVVVSQLIFQTVYSAVQQRNFPSVARALRHFAGEQLAHHWAVNWVINFCNKMRHSSFCIVLAVEGGHLHATGWAQPRASSWRPCGNFVAAEPQT